MGHDNEDVIGNVSPLDAHDEPIEPVVAVECEPSLEKAVRFILAEALPSTLIELYYWTREDDLLSIIRRLAAAPKCTRQALAEFLEAAALQQVALEGISDGTEFTLRKLAEPPRH